MSPLPSSLKRSMSLFDSSAQVAVKDVLFEPVRKTQEATTFKAVVGPSGGTVRIFAAR